MKVRTGLRVPTRAIPSNCTSGYVDFVATRLTGELLNAYNRGDLLAEKVFDANQVTKTWIRKILQDAEIIVRAESSERAAARLAAMSQP